MKQATDRLWAVLVLLGMLLSLGVVLLRPKEVNLYENRPAHQMPRLGPLGLLSGEDQDALEHALTDQVPGAQRLEQNWQSTTTRYLKWGLHVFAPQLQGRYVSFQGMEVLDQDYIVYPTRGLSSERERLNARIENCNAVFAAHPELSFYAYYIEKDTDLNLETDAPTGVSDYVLGNLALPEDHKAVFAVRSAEDFKRDFLRNDHHWNCLGADRAYREIMAMLGKTELLSASEPELVAEGMNGSKALLSGATGFFAEDFYACRYAFPPMEITVNGSPVADYGNRDGVFAPGEITYSKYYGDDDGEICFHTAQSGAGNLLVIGESFDNALLKLLASSYENTYSIDLRNYETDLGAPFDFSAYAAAHEIDTVLLIGNLDYWVLEDFLLEDGV